MKEKEVELSLLLSGSPLGNSSPSLSLLEQSWPRVEGMIIGGTISPSLSAFCFDGKGPWMRGLAPPHLHTGTNPDSEQQARTPALEEG